MIGRALTATGTVTVAGDERQAMDESAWFQGWSETLSHLGCEAYTTVVLETSYRCPEEVVRFVRGLPDGRAPVHPRILTTRFDSECHLTAEMIRVLTDVRSGDPLSTAAIICWRLANSYRSRFQSDKKGPASSARFVGGSVSAVITPDFKLAN